MVGIPEKGCLLRIHLGESDRHHHQPLYEAVVQAARRFGLAGATVLRGSMGFGKASILHTTKVLRLSEDLPIVIEIVDECHKIEEFLPELETMLDDGLVTLETVRVIRYEARPRE